MLDWIGFIPMNVSSTAGGSNSSFDPSQTARIQAQLGALLASPGFAASSRRAGLLRYLVERTLSGEADRISEYSIGLDVFARPVSFDPRSESAVRTEIGRLRQKLKEYYASEGASDDVRIELPPRSYVPHFEIRRPEVESAPEPAVARSRSYFRFGVASAGGLVVVLSTLWWIKTQASAGTTEASPPQGAVQVNGLCKVGNCVKPALVPVGGLIVNTFDFVFTLANSDRYRIQGRFHSRNTKGMATQAPYAVTYVGNASGTTSGADVLTVDLLQNFENLATGGTLLENLHGSFGGPISQASSIRGTMILNDRSLPVQGPFSPPAKFNVTLSGLTLPNLGHPVLKILRRTFTFGAGSGVGAVIRNAIE